MVDKVRAKFFVTGIELFEQPTGSGKVKMTARNSKEGDNTDWSQWTPSGSVEMYITNPVAFDFFKKALDNKTPLYVDFAPIPSTLTEA